jgi:hypothetical protein
VSGVAWERTRELIGSRYHLEYLIVSHEAGHYNFSENTDLSEVLVLARQREGHEPSKGRRVVTCVNLWQQPRTAVESLSLARSLSEGVAPDLVRGQGALQLAIGQKKLGEAVSVPWPAMSDASWGFAVAFAQAELLRALYHLRRGELYLPRKGLRGEVKLVSLGELGELGFDRRDIHDGFQSAVGKTAFPAFWCHAAAGVFAMEQVPNMYLEPLAKAKPGRHLKRATDLWNKAGRLLIAERVRLNTARVVSVRLTEPVLSNVWWTFLPNEAMPDGDHGEKALALWLNSTLGIIMLLGQREETAGAWVQFKKPVLGAMPVLDVRGIGGRRLTELATAYDRLASQGLRPLPDMEGDATRIAIDEAVAETLGLPDLGILRQLLSREPIVCVSMGRLL